MRLAESVLVQIELPEKSCFPLFIVSHAMSNPLRYFDPSGHRVTGECGVYGENCGQPIPPEQPDPISENKAGKHNNENKQTDPAKLKINEREPDAFSDFLDLGINIVAQYPGDLTIYNSPGYYTFGGWRIFIDTELAINNGSDLYIGNESIKFGPVDVTSDSFQFEFFTTRLSSFENSLNIIDFSPWQATVSLDFSYMGSNFQGTNIVGFQYRARPDSLTVVAVGTSIPIVIHYAPILISAISMSGSSVLNNGCPKIGVCN